MFSIMCVCVYMLGLPVVWARGKIMYCVLGGWIGLGCVWCNVSVRECVGEVVCPGQV